MDAAGQIASAFGRSKWLRGYIRGKLRADPVFPAALEELCASPGPVVDLGCGLGLLGFWLRRHGYEEPYRGCDLSAWKIHAAQGAVNRMGWDLELSAGDMTKFPLAGARWICAFDVLHYLGPDVQRAMISRLGAVAKGGATVLLRTGVKGCGWRSAVTIAEEYWTRCSGWIRGGAVNFPALSELEVWVAAEGCRMQARPLWGRTPFSSHWVRIEGR